MPSRMHWRIIDHAIVKLRAWLAIACLIATGATLWESLRGDLFQATLTGLATVGGLVGWWTLGGLQVASITIDELGIRREGRSGFQFTWDQISEVGLEESPMLASGKPYLVLRTTMKKTHLSALAVAGSDLRRPQAALPVDPQLGNELRALMSGRGLLPDLSRWNS